MSRDRPEPLLRTVRRLQEVRSLSRHGWDFLIVDNASQAPLAPAIEGESRPEWPIRFLRTERPGLALGRNAACRSARAPVLVCTDDDVIVPEGWPDPLVEPIVAGEADAAAGRIRLAPNLVRPWMTPFLRERLASTEGTPQRDMIGANMAFTREAFDRVGGFDEQLGAGALGSYEEMLFSLMLAAAGYRIAGVEGGEVEHCFDESRLQREAMVRQARAMGRSYAYVAYHWHHWPARPLGPHYWRMKASLAAKRLVRRPPADHLPEWEWKAVEAIAFAEMMASLRGTPRKYDPARPDVAFQI